MSNPIYGTSDPTKDDTIFSTLVKILESLRAIEAAGSSGAADYEAGGNFYGNGDPNGVVAASRGAVYIQLDESPPAIWFKTTDTVDTGWE